MESSKEASLSVKYSGPSGDSQTFTANLRSCPANPSTEQRTSYLSELRTGISQVQGDINVFLTQKMEEDKAEAGRSALNDEKEEENYGEEVVDA